MSDLIWTRFMDMHSGGGQKLDWAYIYIEAPQAEAEVIFQNRFGRNPNRVTCSCCGEDYSINEEKDLEQATAFERRCDYAYFSKQNILIPKKLAFVSGKGLVDGAYGKYIEIPSSITLEDYLKGKSILVIYAKDIKSKERKGVLRKEGFVWQDGED